MGLGGLHAAVCGFDCLFGVGVVGRCWRLVGFWFWGWVEFVGVGLFSGGFVGLSWWCSTFFGCVLWGLWFVVSVSCFRVSWFLVWVLVFDSASLWFWD